MKPSAIRVARKNAKLTLEQLAEYVEISVSQMSRIETGARKPRVEEIERIAAKLGVPVASLLSGENPPDSAPIKTNEDLVPLSDVRDALFAIVGKLDISDIAAEILVQTILQRLKDRRSPPVGVSRSAAVRTFVHDKVDEFAEQPPDRNQR